MKLEKLNDNQIRCTLNKSDLEKRELRLSELAYGSAKARALFRDMIQQASIELGFEAENIPLMIEAIPISNDCLVLVVTKVEDPDELDTRFSRFSSPFDDEEFEDEYSDDFENSLSDSEVYEEPSSFDDDEEEGLHFGEITDKNIRQAADEALDLIAPFTQAIAQAKKEVLKKKQESAKKKRNHQLYAFSDLDTVTRLSSFLAPFTPERAAFTRTRPARLTTCSCCAASVSRICSGGPALSPPTTERPSAPPTPPSLILRNIFRPCSGKMHWKH